MPDVGEELIYRLRDDSHSDRVRVVEIDTTSAQGKLVFGIFAALAEFERELISERTKAGLESARARGARAGVRSR